MKTLPPLPKPRTAYENFLRKTKVRTEYERLLRMIINHPDPEVRRWALFGYSPFLAKEPYFAPLDILTEGMLVLAPSGSGKTSYFLDPLLTTVAHHDVSSIFIAFKESATSRENCRISAAMGQKKFSYLTTQCGYPSHCLNLIQNLLSADQSGMTAMLRADITTTGIGNNYGKGYGRTHFLSGMILMLAAILRKDLLPPGKQNFRELAKLLFEPRKLQLPGIFDEAVRDSGADVFAAAAALSDLNVINNQKGCDPGEHIDLDAIVKGEQKQVVYVELPFGSRPEASYIMCQTIIAKLTHLLAAMPSTSKLKLLVIIDDAEPAFSHQLSQLFHVARSKGLALVICIQSKHQAAVGNQNLWKSLESFAAVKVLMGVEDPELFEYINATSGRAYHFKGATFISEPTPADFGGFDPNSDKPGNAGQFNGTNWYQPPLMLAGFQTGEESRFAGNNDIMLASARGDMAFIRLRKDTGPWRHHGRMIPTLQKHFITREEYDRRALMPPPNLSGSVIVTATDTLSEIFEMHGRRPSQVTPTWKKHQQQNNRFDRNRPRAGEE